VYGRVKILFGSDGKQERKKGAISDGGKGEKADHAYVPEGGH